MEHKFENQALIEASALPLPRGIIAKLNAALNEDEAYVADELVELSEEILNQIAAVGFYHYIQRGPHKEVYNDFLVQLFNSKGHDYNAGPLYRMAANMVKDCPAYQNTIYYQFFWDINDGKKTIALRIHHLAELRNKVMHGFFVLPPAENHKEATHIGQLLLELYKAKFFKSSNNCHFLSEEGFTGQWNITDDSQWKIFQINNSFGQLCSRILIEQSEQFLMDEGEVFKNGDLNLIPEEVKDFINSNDKGAFSLWVHPADKKQIDYYAAIGQWLSTIKNVRFIGYNLHDKGISFTSEFLISKLLKSLAENEINNSKNKKPNDQLSIVRKKIPEKVVVLINDIHLALFSPQHITKLNNYLYDNNIILIGIGHHYEWFDKFFNKSYIVDFKPTVPSKGEVEQALHNYLRFKEPSPERAEDKEDIAILENIIDKLIKELNTNKKVYARKFADEYNFNIEYVHEIFAILYPWVTNSAEPFEEDLVDELYGFPTTLTEVTPIYLALGRRDLKLEYKHKVIIIN